MIYGVEIDKAAAPGAAGQAFFQVADRLAENRLGQGVVEIEIVVIVVAGKGGRVGLEGVAVPEFQLPEIAVGNIGQRRGNVKTGHLPEGEPAHQRHGFPFAAAHVEDAVAGRYGEPAQHLRQGVRAGLVLVALLGRETGCLLGHPGGKIAAGKQQAVPGTVCALPEPAEHNFDVMHRRILPLLFRHDRCHENTVFIIEEESMKNVANGGEKRVENV